MTTHRSLNKLEFKAHMSIHNKTEVTDAETQGGNYTHDRFGKKHCVNEASESPRARRKKRNALLSAFLFSVGSLSASQAFAVAENGPRHSTDVAVESQPLDKLMLNEKSSPPEKPFALYRDEDTAIGLNENGDPNMSVRF